MSVNSYLLNEMGE